MRRSSTMASAATVRRRLQGEKLLQNSSEATSPSKPPTIRMTPTVLILNPGGVDLHGEGQDCANDEQEEAEADPHRHASSDITGLPSGLLSAGDAVL